jgi:predicted Zn-dependent protease
MIPKKSWVLLMLAALLNPAGHGQQSDVAEQYRAAQEAVEAGDTARAEATFAGLAKSHPEVAEVHASLGALLFQDRRYREALDQLEQAKREKPGLPKIAGLIAMCEAELGEFEQALPELKRTYATAEDLSIKRFSGLELERAYSGLRRDTEAAQIALDMQRLFPKDPEVLYRNERIFGNMAFLTVQTLFAVAPDSVWRHEAQAELLESEGQHEAAITEYRQVLAVDPSHIGVHYHIGRCFREENRDTHDPAALQKAMTEFQAELAIDPDNANAYYEIGELDRLDHKLDAAKESFATALRLFPDFPEANIGMGSVLSALGQPSQALPYLHKAIQDDPDDEAAWYRLAQAERDAGDKQAQQSALARFLQLHGKSAPSASGHDVTPQTLDTDKP